MNQKYEAMRQHVLDSERQRDEAEKELKEQRKQIDKLKHLGKVMTKENKQYEKNM